MQKPSATRLQRLLNIVEGHRILFRFLVVDGWQLIGQVVARWENPISIQHSVVADGPTSSTSIRFRRDFVDGYNRRYEDIRRRMLELVHNRGRFSSYYALPLFLVRIATVLAAAFFGFGITAAVSLLQFIVAPYSFFASLAAWINVQPYFATHFVYFAVVQFATGLLYADLPTLGHYARIPIDNTFIVAWFLIDQGICLLLCYWTPIGKPVRIPAKRIFQSFWYGFINCKSYWLVLLLCLRGLHIDLLAIVLVAVMPSIIRRAANRVFFRYVLPRFSLHWTFPSAMFYHYHRMVHLPGPYSEAHRHHHHLPDATPFDAHIYGSGMPEEWFKLMTETGICLATGIVPWSFSWSMVLQSLANKIGHTRIEGERPITDNFHVNHHLKHFRNFGFSGLPLDLLFDTAHGDVSALGRLTKTPQRCVKLTEPDHYVLVIESFAQKSAKKSEPPANAEGRPE